MGLLLPKYSQLQFFIFCLFKKIAKSIEGDCKGSLSLHGGIAVTRKI